MIEISGAGVSETVKLSQELLLRCSGFYAHAASFGNPPDSIQLQSGHRGVQLLAAALRSGTAALGPATLADLLQAASYLQVSAVLEAAAAYLRDHVLDRQPGATLRVALDLGLASLQAHIERSFLDEFYMLSGDRAAVLLKEWPPAKRRQLLGSPALCAPTECCLLETLCHLAKQASSAEAASLLDCVRWELMTAHEVAVAALFLQHNAKWVDRRLSTAAAWHLLNASIAREAAAGAVRGAEREATGRAAHARALHARLDTGQLAESGGTAMYLSEKRIPVSFLPGNDQQQGGPSSAQNAASGGGSGSSARPMVLQLEREDPRHAAAEQVGGVTGGGGAADSGGSGWDLQLSLDPDRFPAGFQAACWAFGTDGFFWCKLGPLVKPGPTWWKVGFLESQLCKALPKQLLHAGLGGVPGGGESGGLLLVGWWVPEQ